MSGTPDTLASAALADAATEAPKVKGKSKPAAKHLAKHDAPVRHTAVLGEPVIFTPSASEAEAQTRTRGVVQADFAAIVTGLSDDGSISLRVMPPMGDSFNVSGVREGEVPHSWRARDLPF